MLRGLLLLLGVASYVSGQPMASPFCHSITLTGGLQSGGLNSSYSLPRRAASDLIRR
jgi:hypothetical protein